jgi:hypothetical protein
LANFIINQGFLSSASAMIRQGYFVAPVVPVNGLGLLGAVITKMEAVNVGDSYWDRGIWEDGMWEHDTPMIKLIRQMEKT